MGYENEEYNQHLKALILEVVDNQVKDNNPPITRITLNRLISAGYSNQKAKEKIGAVLTEQIYDVMSNKESFDEEWYEKQLSKLK